MKGLLPIAAGGYISTWSVGFFFQSLATPASVDYFGANDPLIPSLVLALAMAPSALGGPLSARIGTRASRGFGLAATFATSLALLACMVAGQLALFFVLEVLFAVACGIVLSASMHMLISASTPQENASVVSLTNFSGYAGSTVISTVATAVADSVDLAWVFALIVAMAAVSVVPGCIKLAKEK